MSEKELHPHGTDCACGHNHHHHDDGCGCGHDHAHEDIDKKAFLRKFVPGLFFFLLGAAVEHLIPGSESSTLWHYVELAAFALSYIFVGFSILREAVEGVLAKNIFNENLLMAVASLGAFAIGEYSEGCAVVLLYTVGEFLQSLAVQKSRRSIKGMLEQKPDTVRIQAKDGLTEAAPETVQPGQTIVVEPGEKIHLDGTVLEGNAEVDTAALTGESIPVSVAPGMEVLAGSVAIDGALTIRVDKPYGDSAVARVLAALEHAQDSKSHTEKFITRFARIYTPIVCGIALALVLIPPLFFGGDWHEWIYRGLSALVVSCPCAIVISVPLSFFGGLGTCSREGILVKGADHLETLARCDVGVFDKTGTITSGKFEFVRCECVHCHCIDKHNHRELLRIIAACERLSTHPIAKSICLAFGQFADDCVVTDAKNYAGMGVSAVVDGVRYYAGNEKLMQKIGVPFTETQLVGTAVYCCTDTEFLGDIVFADIIKTDSREAIDRLHHMGMKQAIMLTGDREPIAADIAAKAGLDGYYAKLLGLPVKHLVVASDKNNVLFDFLTTGTYNRQRPFFQTISPSMDILISSNLERMLYYLSEGDTRLISMLMNDLNKWGTYEIPEELLAKIRQIFGTGWADEDQVRESIKHCWDENHYVIDPHTACGYHVMEQTAAVEGTACRVLLSTASPYKFPKAVAEALGLFCPPDDFACMEVLAKHTGTTAPAQLAGLKTKPVRFEDVVDVADMGSYVEQAASRIAKEA